MPNTSADFEFHYPDFVDLIAYDGETTEDGCFDWFEDLRICPKGIFLITEPYGVWLSHEERAALPRHPTGSYDEPILRFPSRLRAVQNLLKDSGLSDCIDPGALTEWIAKRSADAGTPSSENHPHDEQSLRKDDLGREFHHPQDEQSLREDDLRLELYPILDYMAGKGERITAGVIMRRLKDLAGRRGSCITETCPEGVLWSRGTSGQPEKLTMPALKARITRWRNFRK